MNISKVRERIKNLILFHTGKFDKNKPEDVQLAEKIAANATMAMAEYIKENKGQTTAVLETNFKSDANWWNPDSPLPV